MAILKIARMGHPVLRHRAELVSDPKSQEIQQLVRDMVETLQDIGGIGLAAPQVHVSKRVVIFFVPGSRRGGAGGWWRKPTILSRDRPSAACAKWWSCPRPTARTG